MVSVFSMLCMAVSAVVAAAIPVVLFRMLRQRMAATARPAWIGAAVFILSVLIAENIFHILMLKVFHIIDRTTQPFAYMIYGALMAGVFEETARLVAFRYLRKKYSGVQTALAYGIGHGGCESVLLLGLPMLANIVFSIMINSGNVQVLSAMQAQVDALTTTAAPMFLVSSVERLMAVIIQIALSILVFYAVFARRMWLYPAAILLHALVDCPPALMQTGYISSIPVVYAWVLLCAAGLSYLAWKVHRKYGGCVEEVPQESFISLTNNGYDKDIVTN